MLTDWLIYVGATVAALLPIVNPISTAPVFVAATRRFSLIRRISQAKMAAIYMSAVLLTTLVAGALVLEFFGISVPVLRIGGGLIVTRIGFGMLNPAPATQSSSLNEEETQAMNDVAFTPIAMPMLSGPGSIAATIAMATQAPGFLSYTAIAAGILIVALVSWLVLRSSSSIFEFIGTTGMEALTRIMGLLLVCVGIQFVATGIVEGLVSEPMVSILRDWLEALRSS